jgi:hypothetical protein
MLQKYIFKKIQSKLRKKVAQNFGLHVELKKLPKVNHCSFLENSPNMVTLQKGQGKKANGGPFCFRSALGPIHRNLSISISKNSN